MADGDISSKDEAMSLAGETPWIEWKGGECPVPIGTNVQIRYRTGDDDPEPSPVNAWMANHAIWEHNADNPKNDIIAYRVLP